MRRLVHRHQPRVAAWRAALGAVGATVGVMAVAAISILTDEGLLIAPFGATAALLFSVSSSPLSQPVNVVGGYLLAASVGLLMNALLPAEWWAVAIAVGIAVGAMALARVTHPPAAGTPVVIATGDPDLMFLLWPILAGVLVLIAAAVVFHRLTGTVYPLRPPEAER